MPEPGYIEVSLDDYNGKTREILELREKLKELEQPASDGGEAVNMCETPERALQRIARQHVECSAALAEARREAARLKDLVRRQESAIAVLRTKIPDPPASPPQGETR